MCAAEPHFRPGWAAFKANGPGFRPDLRNITFTPVKGQTLSLGCHIHTVPSIRVSRVRITPLLRSGLVGLVLWLVSGIALNKYRCEYGTLNSMFALNCSSFLANPVCIKS